MAEIVLFTLVRFLLPLTLIFASLARPVAMSILYLVMFLASPFLMQSKSNSQRTVLSFYLRFVVLLAGLFSLGHLAINFKNIKHITFFKLEPSVIIVLRQIGLLDFSGLRPLAIIHWILPDIMVTLVALMIIIFRKISDKMYSFKQGVSSPSLNASSPRNSPKDSDMNRLLISYLQSFIKTSPIFALIILFFAAVLRPSLPGSLYFLVFIVTGTYWALYRHFTGGLPFALLLIVIVLSLHLICFLLYQLRIVNNYFDGESFWPRIMGLEVLLLLFNQNQNGSMLKLNDDLGSESYLSPIAMMCAYSIIVLHIVNNRRQKIIFSNIREKIAQKTEGKIPDSDHQPEHSESATINTENPSTLEQFFYMICDVTSFIYKNSYILLNIIMMIWSIIYHSWLTFVFLIWANILWMIPNQRRSMMRSSFFVVLYAEFLIITQYIFGMNLNETELPTSINGINVAQIGFIHPLNRGDKPCLPLIVQTSFLFIFWITSHQYFKEKLENKDNIEISESDILTQLFGPHHSRDDSRKSFEKSSAHRAFIFVFESVSNFITRIWMWLLIFLIFLCAMLDSDMTGFRICYMSLFLLFLMVFQMSLELWIRFLYGYWMFVIFYAMTILIIIYTYQFDYFDYYWEKFLHIKPTLQTDMGLRRYRTKELFLHLLVPTLTVIFTVIQLHYFHRRFIRSVIYPGSTDKKKRFPGVHFKTRKTGIKRRSWIEILVFGYRRLRSSLYRWFRPSKLVAWRFLEMHMIKIVIFTTFVCAISEICCFNLLLVILALMSVCVSRIFRKVIFRIVTCWISILILMKMMYQMKYYDESHYEHKCNNYTVNFADWMGLRKTDQTWGSFLRYIAPYIVYMIVTTLHAVVKLRDHLIRFSLGEIRERKLLFPHTSRQDAERNFSCLLKYLLNYGYFKFGLEITFIALVASIAHRRDVLAVTYVAWLILLLCLNRKLCSRVWCTFQLYFVLSIFIQYIYIIHFPPNLCLASAKHSECFKDNRPFEEILDEPTKSKLMLDFIVLLFISRQRKAFKAEVREMNNLLYPGGDNRNIVHNIAKLGHVYFKNPTHDFCSFVRNYSDVFKTVVFCSFLWITLAMVFMGGVCSMDMLSLGYLIFALVFLLQGSEVYLMNIHYIIWRWNMLIAFNVFNIVIKVCIIVFGNMLNIKYKQDYQSLFAVMDYDKSLPVPEDVKQHDESVGYHYGPNSLIFENILVWHAIIFAFVIFQNRIFRSYYFCHIIMDTQANTVLASRGAIVIENLHYKQIHDRLQYEKIMLENLKAKMEIIRTNNVMNYKRGRALRKTVSQIGSLSTTEAPITSTTLRNLNLVRSSPLKRRDMRLHPHVIHAGDYYMFDEEDDDDEPNLREEFDFLEQEDLRTRQMLISAKNKRAQQKNGDNEYSSDSDIDFDANPIVKLMTELIIVVTLRLNRLSRNFRFVHKVLSAEKKTLQDISTMNRLGLVNTAAMFSFLNQSLYNKQMGSITVAPQGSMLSLISTGKDFTSLDHNVFVQMLISLYYAIIANTEVISYLMVFINQAANSSIISLPMPFLVLYWGALTLPRPTKTFWVTLITYTLGMIFIKCITHQKIVVDQKLIKTAQTMDFELFIKHGKAVYDFLLLVVLIWHRYMLKKQGIWNTPRSYTPDPLRNLKSGSKMRSSDISKPIRQESGSEIKDNTNNAASSSEFERDMDDLLRPGIENKYVYENIESEYYRTAIKRLEQRGGLLASIKIFFLALLHKARLSTDVYTLLFLCDFINFFVLLFGFPQFVYRHRHNISVLETYIQGNNVPVNFLIMLMVQFSMIVAERAIYLRKAIKTKIAFHFLTVIAVHMWMFFAIPYVTAHSFEATALVIFYLIKCLHMVLSAYQIRCGYPKRIMGNVFTKSYSMANYVAFKVYMEIPFLYILRTLLDWLCINTTLTIMEWIKMEDIFQSVFIVRCYRQMDVDLPVERGVPKELYAKCLVGGTVILILIVLIWSPLILFALIATVGKANVPRIANLAIKIEQYEPIYVSQSYSGIHQFSNKDYSDLQNAFNHDIYVTDHIINYDHDDVSAVKFDANSVKLWSMSPPDKKRLLADLKSGKSMKIRLQLSFTIGGSPAPILEESIYTLTTNKERTREMLINAISDENSKAKIIVPDILPKFLTIQKNEVHDEYIKDYEGKQLRPIILQRKQVEGDSWWEMHDFCEDKYYKNILSNLPLSNCDDGVVFYIFNDKSFPKAMSFFEKTSIIGLYTTCVYVVSRLIRTLIANNHRRIMFEDLPFVDRILRLCNDIYLVRETKEYRLEEDLYAKLIFLYRSPETLIKYTRYKEDKSEDVSGSVTTRVTTSEDEDEDEQGQQPPATPPPPTPPPQ